MTVNMTMLCTNIKQKSVALLEHHEKTCREVQESEGAR